MDKYYDPAFDPKKVKEELIDWIRDFFEKNGKGCKAVVAISGGKDSSITAALCKEALGTDRVYGVLLPNGVQADIGASRKLVAHLGIDHCTINIRQAFDGIVDELQANLPTEVQQQTITNLPARLRMAAVYAVSQSMNGRVANTCNLSEDWVGYATRYGDGAGDFSPLSHLTVQEVRAIGTELGLPRELVFKVPIDGLTPLTDEEHLGFTYDVLDRYIRTGICDDPEIKKKIDQKRKANAFKLKQMPSFPHNGKILADDPSK